MTPGLGRALVFCARHGRWFLALGLVAGLLLPGLAQLMRPWLPQMVAALLVVTAMRVGFAASVGSTRHWPRALREVLALQLALPLIALGCFWVFGLADTVVALAVVLMLSAPSVTGSPNFAAIMGHDPAPAMQVMVMGTALFPITSLVPMLLLAGVVPGFEFGPRASLGLIAVILGAVALGFTLRALLLPEASAERIRQLDGLGVLALSIVVIGLMAGIGPLLESARPALAGWLALALIANFGAQTLTFAVLYPRTDAGRAVALSMIAGNRNVALFLLVLPADVVDPLLPFIGCYQIPMYLTPLVMARLYRRATPPA